MGRCGSRAGAGARRAGSPPLSGCSPDWRISIARGAAARSRETVTDRIAVIGAGQMGSGIAQVFAQSGFRVVMIDVAESALSKGRDTIAKTLDKQIEKGVTPAAERE